MPLLPKDANLAIFVARLLRQNLSGYLNSETIPRSRSLGQIYIFGRDSGPNWEACEKVSMEMFDNSYFIHMHLGLMHTVDHFIQEDTRFFQTEPFFISLCKLHRSPIRVMSFIVA